MTDDRLSRESTREIFEAIVSAIVDPELVRLRRIFLALGCIFFAVGAGAVAVVGGLGWAGLVAFSSTFLPGVVVARKVLDRRFARQAASRGWAGP
ncbi:MAG: hypothetical protein ACRD1D_03650 [Acidimicrobiales bacterium]